MKKGNLSIHSENIFPIIKKWLYSEKDIFLRELVANASDAISKLKILQSRSLTETSTQEFRINIVIDKEKKILSIEDNGIGMTEEEIEKYISQIAFSGAQDFLEKYKKGEEKDQFIGHFGLGFFSAYMVATKVEIETLSHQKDAQSVFWSCDGSTNYTIKESKKQDVGTKVTLFIDEEKDYLEENKIQEILQRFCPYLSYPIYLNGKHINNKDPLYLKNPSTISDKEYVDFYHELYPLDPDPLFWIHINVDFPFHVKGILYFPKIHPQFDFQTSKIKLFCNRVFVSDNCKDLLADYLMILRGAIDSFDIPLNVSRSFLQMDMTVKQLGSHISKKIADRFLQLYNTDKEKFTSLWQDIEVIIKLGILQDEKFYDRAKNFLIWKNAVNEWTTIEEYLERNKEKNKNKVYYSQEQTSSCLSLYKEKNIEVLFTQPYLDTSIISFLESKLNIQFLRIDAHLEDLLLDPSREKNLLEEDGKSQAIKIAEFIQALLKDKTIKVEAKSLDTSSLPGFFLIKEEHRRLRDYFMMHKKQETPMPIEETFIVNTNNLLVQKAYEIRKFHPELAKKLIFHIYDCAKIAQKDMKDLDFETYTLRSQEIMQTLLEK